MGAWGFGVFDNDSSCDFIMELYEESDITARIKNVFDTVINEKEYIELDDAAAAWVCLSILDKKLNDFDYDCPDIEYDEIIERAVTDELKNLTDSAKLAADCIVSDISELNELIGECEDDYDMWKSSVMEIKERL